MAIVQVSRITNRKGLTENLPQLAGAELGWCLDSRRLFIGNGTLQSGAPVIGNTEILTEFSDITALSLYTYKDVAVGYAAQTGPSPSEPVVRTVQQKLDDFADVRDFGAVGDGATDDTAAINRALYQLYCRDTNTEIRRTLYFPAGTYSVTSSILIPPYAKLVGEGADCSIIRLDASADYVARYSDNQQQVGTNIGEITPTNIEISSMTFQSTVITDIFQVALAQQCYFDSVNFIGPFETSNITDPGFNPNTTDNIAGVRFLSTDVSICNTITFDKCRFSGTAYAIKTPAGPVDEPILMQSITVSNGKLDTLYQGIVLEGTPTSSPGVYAGATGFRIVQNMFDDVYAEGVIYDNVGLNVTAHNVFYNVGNSIGAGTPTYPVITFTNDNNVSVCDMFERSWPLSQIQPRIYINTTSSLIGGGTQLQMGKYTRGLGVTIPLIPSASSQPLFSFNSNLYREIAFDYTIIRDATTRRGRLIVVPGPDDSSSQVQYTDDYTETSSTGITLWATESGSTIDILYSSTAGSYGSITLSIERVG